MLVCDVLAVKAVGCVRVTVCVTTQEAASVMVQVYDPAVRPLAVAAVPPLGAQEYVFAPIPPVTETVADPVLPPLQAMFVCDEIDGTIGLTVSVALLLVAGGFKLPVAITRYKYPFIPAVTPVSVSVAVVAPE
jgi:hypothetical protein